jgi:transposase
MTKGLALGQGRGHHNRPNGGSTYTKLDEATANTLCEMLAAGHYYETAARAVRLHKTTLYDWLARGKRDSEAGEMTMHAQLYHRIRAAEVAAEQGAIECVRRWARRDWTAARFLLERKYPERWASRGTMTKAIDQELGEMLAILRARLDSDTFELVSSALAEIQADLEAAALGEVIDAAE